MDFNKFIQNQVDRLDNIGEFAQVFMKDGVKLSPPIKTDSYGLWCLWVRKHGDKEAVKAFKACWTQYYHEYCKKVVSLAAYREYKATRSPSEQAFAGLDRLHRLE
jgi:hypothetical protein